MYIDTMLIFVISFPLSTCTIFQFYNQHTLSSMLFTVCVISSKWGDTYWYRGEVWRHVTMVAKFWDHNNREQSNDDGDGDGDGNENGKKAKSLDRKTTTLLVHHAVL